MRVIKILLLPFLFLSACQERPSKKEVKKPNTGGESLNYYVLSPFYQKQIQFFQVLHYRTKLTTDDGINIKTSFLNKEQLNAWVTHFLLVDSFLQGNKYLYREDIFNDASLKSIGITYSSVSAEPNIKNINILLNDSTQLVTRVFIREELKNNDTLQSKHLSWNAYKGFDITISKRVHKKQSHTLKYRIQWLKP